MKSHKICEDDTGMTLGMTYHPCVIPVMPMSSPSLLCHPQTSHVSPFSPHDLHVVPKPPMLSPNLPCNPCCPHVIPKPPILSLCHPQASRNYRPQCSCGKVMFLHLSVSHSVHGARGCLADNPLGRHPQADTPTPTQCMLGCTPPSRRPLQRTVRILLECFLVLITFY